MAHAALWHGEKVLPEQSGEVVRILVTRVQRGAALPCILIVGEPPIERGHALVEHANLTTVMGYKD